MLYFQLLKIMGVQDSTIKNNVEQCDLALEWSKLMRIFTQ